MVAPTVNENAHDDSGVDESAVWSMFSALSGALVGSPRTEVWTVLTDARLQGTRASRTEDLLFKSAASLVLALRAEANDESPSDHLADAHAYLVEAVGSSPVQVW